MSDKSKIEWTDATWNPVTGCTKVSAGCKNCYAEREFPRVYPGRAFTDVRLHPDRLDQPVHWKRPRRIFVNSMSDLFHDAVPDQFIAEVFGIAAWCDRHTFQVLTKRPDRAEILLNSPCWRDCVEDAANELGAKFHLSWPCALGNWPLANLWLGFSAEDQETFDERWTHMRRLAEADWIVWASLEPLLGRILLPEDYLRLARWIVAGGESGSKARPSHPDWFRQVRDDCHAAGVAFFFKQWGEWIDFDSANQHYSKIVKKHTWPRPNDIGSYWLGKKLAGRVLDGRTWDEFPEIGARRLRDTP